MKKLMYVSTLLLLSVLVGCSNTIQIQSRPEGYAIVSTDYAAKGSFLYDSQTPFNVNEVTLSLYLMPHLWGEIKSEQASSLADNDPNFIIFEENLELSPTKRAFVKYINIQYDFWTAYNVDGNIVYKNDSDIDFVSYLAEEDNVKEYIEAINMGQVYFLDNERCMLIGYQSIYDNDLPNYQLLETLVANINYAVTLEAMPDLSSHFGDYDSSDLTILFMRTYEHRDDPEFKTLEYTN